MADLQQKTASGFQLVTRGLQKLFGPFAVPGQKAIRDEYLTSLGIAAAVKEPAISKLDEFNKKKAEEADALAFAQALQELTDIVVNIEDAIQSADQNSSRQFASDMTTVLLNALAMDYFRREMPSVHNFILILFALNNMSNRAGGAVPIGDVVGDYFNTWLDSMDFDFESREEARKFTEVWFTLLAVGSYVLNNRIRKATTNPEVEITIGGQFGYELEHKTALLTAQDETNELFGRVLTFSYTQTNPSVSESERGVGSMYFTFLPLADENKGSSVIVITDGEGTPFKNLRLGGDWFVTADLGGSVAVRVGGDATEQTNGSAGDLPLNFHTALAFEYLPFKKDVSIDDVTLETLFDVFRLGFGNLSIQLILTDKDIAVRIVTQLMYAFTKGGKKGFPYKFIPEKKDIVQLPFSFSLKNGFGFDGGFIGERPPDQPAPRNPTALERRSNAASTGKTGTLDIPIHRDLGVARFDKLHLGFDTGAGLAVTLTVDFAIKFGKVAVVSIAELGTSVAATKRAEAPKQGGVFGYDLAPAFVPPKGAGIAIDAKIIKGGGFLYFNEQKGEYFGAIELGLTGLSFFPNVKLNAIGIIRTKDDAGNEQFSLLLLITAEFLPIQIGFGFTWNGVGGLLALNRRANLAYLQEGLGSGVLQSVLFPRDVVANMSRIISDLTAAFPVADGNFVVGLMVKLGWGTPTKITADIGLILDMRDAADFRIVLLGVLRAKLPTEKKPVLNLQAAFLGVYDHKNEFLYFRADLVNSSLLNFKLTGSLVLGISWGTSPVFVLSAGGFHPRFKEIPVLPTLPNAFKNLQRIGIQLLDDENPRLAVETYLAVTSNTVQVGGKAELFYDVFSGAGGYNIYGRLEVNALFHFDPFRFTFDIAAEIALRDGTSWVMGIGVYGELQGPKPWHLKVRAVAEIDWFPDIEVDLEMTWGRKSEELPPAVAQVNALMRAAFRDARNWEAKTTRKTGVLLQKNKAVDAGIALDAANALRLDPGGGLKFSQSIAPLDFALEKFGEQTADVARFTVESVRFGTDASPAKPVTDLFAAEMFVRLTDDERLSRPSFERMSSGFELTDSDALRVGALQVVGVTGEISGLDNRRLTDPSGSLLNLNVFRRIVRASSAAYKSAASAETRLQPNFYQHLAVETTNDEYVIVTKDALEKPFGFAERTFSSFAEAQQAIQAKPSRERLNLQAVKKQELL